MIPAVAAMGARLFGMHPSDAIKQLVCVRCKADVATDMEYWDQADRDEYGISAICPACFNAMFRDEDEA